MLRREFLLSGSDELLGPVIQVLFRLKQHQLPAAGIDAELGETGPKIPAVGDPLAACCEEHLEGQDRREFAIAVHLLDPLGRLFIHDLIVGEVDPDQLDLVGDFAVQFFQFR